MVRQLISRGVLVGAALLGLEAAYAVLRPSPDLQEFDPSKDFGNGEDPPLRISVLGDSSVTAPGVDGPEEIWVSHVCNRLAETRHVAMKSFAVGGALARDLVDKQLEPAIAFDPDLVFVSVGANDAIKGVPLKRFERDLDFLICELTATGAVVVQSGVGDLGTIPRLYPPLRNLISRRAWVFDRAHWAIAERHGSAVVDQRSDDLDVWYEDRSLWAADLFHVSARGHERWANMVWQTLDPLLNGSHGSN